MARLPYFDLLLDGRPPEAPLYSLSVHAGLWDGAADLRAAMSRLDEAVLEAAGLEDGQAVCDAGCGLGGTLAAADARGAGMALTGVNLDDRQLAAARAHVPGRGANALRFLRADACALPLEAASQDRLLAVECVFHFPSRLAFLREAARVLRPGGRLALTDFVPWSVSPLFPWRRLERLLEEGWGDVGAGWPDGGYAAMAAAAGLRLSRDEDLTARTLPTYPAMRELLRIRPSAATAALSRGAARLERLCRWGLLSYRLVVLDKPA